MREHGSGLSQGQIQGDDGLQAWLANRPQPAGSPLHAGSIQSGVASAITYWWTDEGWLYLAIVLDLFNRELVGWSLKPRMATDIADIVIDALTMAWFRRKPAAGVLHHSDRGSLYASHAFQGKSAEYGMTLDESRGNCWDDAPTESWFNRFKNERVYGWRFATREQMTATAFEYIEVFYNRERRHSALGYVAPAQFEGNEYS